MESKPDQEPVMVLPAHAWWKETKLLPAPRPAAVGKVRVWILLGVLVVALVFAGWRWREVIISALAF